MTRSTTAWRLLRQAAPVVALAGSVVLFVVALAVAIAGNRISHVLPGLGPIAFACVGAVIVRRQPSNRIGWLLGAASVPLALLIPAVNTPIERQSGRQDRCPVRRPSRH
jgi:hypothetical protein